MRFEDLFEKTWTGNIIFLESFGLIYKICGLRVKFLLMIGPLCKMLVAWSI
jgi:hypothetical protein